MENVKPLEEQKPIQISYEDIIKEGENIYPLLGDLEKKSFEFNKIDNWSELFYNIKSENCKHKFNELASKSLYSKFFEGLNYEYGINNKKQDLKIAFNIYKEGADKDIDVMCMYRLYHIYKNDFIKFNFPKRNRIYEKYYLFKTFSFLNYSQLQRISFLLNRFDIPLEVVFQFDQEDPNFAKFNQFLSYLKKYNKELNISIKDITIIESTFTFKFGNGENKNIATKYLLSLIPEEKANSISDKIDLEIYYKVACFLYDQKKYDVAESYFKYLINAEYYKAFPDYANYLYEILGEGNKALIISTIALDNGAYLGNNIHYNIFLSLFNFEQFGFKEDEKLNGFLKNLLDILVNNFILDEIHSYFEYFYFMKMLKKFKYDNLIKEYSIFTKEFAEYIINITCLNSNNKEEDNEYLGNDYNKNKILEYFQRNEFYCELNFVSGFLLYYGVDNVIEKDYVKSLEKLKIAYKNTHSKSYKRFCYNYIYKVRKKLNEKEIINPKNKSLLVSNNKLNKTKSKLFHLHKSCIEEENISYLSSSFFYSISKLYSKNIGNKGDPLFEFICLQRAAEWDTDNLIEGSIICYYRRHKAKKLLENKNKYDQVLQGIKSIKDSEGYGEDNSLCPICFERKRNILCLPCKHLYCDNCTIQIMEKRKCPICRGGIIMVYRVQFVSKKDKKEKEEKEQKEQKEEKEENKEKEEEKENKEKEKKEENKEINENKTSNNEDNKNNK